MNQQQTRTVNQTFLGRTVNQKDLDQLFAHDIYEPVQCFKCVVPITTVLKDDGSVRICGYYK